MREIREEEARRRGEVEPIRVAQDFGSADGLVYGPMRMIDPGMELLMNRAYDRYEKTMLARNPHMREHINFRNRGA